MTPDNLDALGTGWRLAWARSGRCAVARDGLVTATASHTPSDTAHPWRCTVQVGGMHLHTSKGATAANASGAARRRLQRHITLLSQSAYPGIVACRGAA